MGRNFDAQLANGAFADGRTRRINDRLMLVEQSLLDESAPPEQRWYRHVIHGWNIYSLYQGQPLPGRAEALGTGDQTRVEAEVNRIEAALARMLKAVESITPAAGF